MRVVYSDLMNAPAQGYSPSAGKPAAVIAAWLAEWPPLQVRDPVPVTRDQLCLAHEAAFVDGVLSLRKPNGFATRSAAVAALEFRERRRATIQATAEATGLNRMTLSKLANHHGANPQTDAIDRLCEYFNCRVEELVEHVTANAERRGDGGL